MSFNLSCSGDSFGPSLFTDFDRARRFLLAFGPGRLLASIVPGPLRHQPSFLSRFLVLFKCQEMIITCCYWTNPQPLRPTFKNKLSSCGEREESGSLMRSTLSEMFSDKFFRKLYMHFSFKTERNYNIVFVQQVPYLLTHSITR